MPRIGAEPIAQIDHRVRTVRGEPAAGVEPRERMREGVPRRCRRFAPGLPSPEGGTGAAEKAGNPEPVAGTGTAPRERTFRPAHDRDGETPPGPPREIAAEHLATDGADRSSHAPHHRNELRRVRLARRRERREQTDAV